MTETVSVMMESNYAQPEGEVFLFPASSAQERLWFLAQLVPENPFYNVSAAIQLTGSLNIPVLEQTFNEIVRRHEALRTTFIVVEGQLMQVITPNLHLPLTVIDLQQFPVIEREQIAQQQAIAGCHQPFNLTTNLLLRVTLWQQTDSEYLLLLSLHHIVADGWSIGVLLRELGILYSAFNAGQPSPLPDLPIQYADFAHWQRQYLQGAMLEPQLAYWRQQLANLPDLALPSDRPRPAMPSYRGATQQRELSADLTADLETLSQQAGSTLFMTLLAAFQTLMYRYTGQDDVVVGSPIANRSLSQIEGLIGFFVNNLVLRTDLSGEPTFRDLLRRVQATTLAAYAHQDLPFEKLVETLQPNRDLSRNPLFQVVFALQNTPIAPLELPGLTLNPLDFEAGTTRFDLEFHCFKSLGTLKCRVVYSTDLFDATRLDRLLDHFQTLLTEIVANPDQQITHLPLLTLDESDQLFAWNATQTDYSSDLFHQQFEAQVTRTPDAIAIVDVNQQLTYRELNQRANQLAHKLQQLGVQPETLVGLCSDRSANLAIGILGIWKAGGAYLPLDPVTPGDRLGFMLSDAQISILVTQLTVLPLFADYELNVVCLDQDCTTAQPSPANLTSSATPNHLAYVIYTSGSTGTPKGVLVEHRGLSNLAQAQLQRFNLQASDRVLQFASLNFDAAIFELVMALGSGAALYIAPSESRLPGIDLLQFLRDNCITHATLPPAVLSMLPSDSLPALKMIVSAGEACSNQIVDRWAKNRQFFNAYGPTEATIWATLAALSHGSQITIGHPIPNTQVYLLDAYGQPVAIGVTGELYIGGVGVARGYLNRPELTVERFIANAFDIATVKTVRTGGVGAAPPARGSTPAPLPNSLFNCYRSQTLDGHLNETPGLPLSTAASRLYKTGDLARYESDGSLEFMGRVDNQVKIRGIRVELGEIEAVLSQHAGVQAALVTVRRYAPEDQRLVAYVVLHSTQAVTANDLREYVRSQLPSYLIPAAFVLLDTLPLTLNGKIDYAALPAPNQIDRSGTVVAPRTPIEVTLVQIWAELLQRQSVSIHDNFFDLGGDSLLATRLVAQVQQHFKQALLLSTLFLAPTIAQLATAIAPNPKPLPWSPLVPLQPNGSKPPFFCVHPIFGVVFPYCHLAQHLGNEHPFYGLQPLGLDGSHAPYDRIEDMAAYYIQAIRVIQPQGPYFLAGWSFGGLVAFEMAQQLQRVGQPIALLALLDTPAPSNHQPSVWNSLTFLVKTAVRSLLPFWGDYLALLTRSDASWQTQLQRAAITNLLPQESRLRILDELTIRPMLHTFAANSRAVQRYIPQVYSDRITLFKTATSARKISQDAALGWNELTTVGITLHSVPGNHFSMLRQPQVEVLASQLQQYL